MLSFIVSLFKKNTHFEFFQNSAENVFASFTYEERDNGKLSVSGQIDLAKEGRGFRLETFQDNYFWSELKPETER